MNRYSSLAGKRILVTGVSGGIGRAIARALAHSGASVLGTFHRNREGIAELLAEMGALLHPYQIDLGDREQTRRLIAAAGPLDGLVNNAAEFDLRRFAELDLDAWDRTLAVNLTAPVQLAHGLRLTDGAAIVNVASIDGLTGSYTSLAYAASKAALVNLTRSLANVLGPRGIRVNAVCPGWTEAGMTTGYQAEAAAATPLGRTARPGEIAATVTFLLSGEASFVTGAALIADGGYTGADPVLKREDEDMGRDS